MKKVWNHGGTRVYRLPVRSIARHLADVRRKMRLERIGVTVR